MADPIVEELIARQKGLLGGPQAKISAKPESSTSRKVLELLTGYPADPDREIGPFELLLSALPSAGMVKTGARPLAASSAKLTRAAKQGFTTPVYHATQRSFPAFREAITTNASSEFVPYFAKEYNIPDPEHNLALIKNQLAVKRSGGAPDLKGESLLDDSIRVKNQDFGIHVTPEPETANRAIGMDPLDVINPKSPVLSAQRGSNVMPLLARIKKSFEVRDMGSWKNPVNWAGYPGDSVLAKETNDRATLQKIIDTAQGYVTDKKVLSDPVKSLPFQGELKKILEEAGYDSIKYPNRVEGKGEPSYLLLNPNQVRSRFAKFDPTKTDSSDLLASIAAALGLNSASQDK